MTSALEAAGIPGLPFVAAFLFWILSEVVTSARASRARTGVVRSTSTADRRSRAAIYLGVLVSVVAISSFAENGFATLPLSVVYLGVALVAVGIAFRQWAIYVLGRFFSTELHSVAGQRIVTEGPYRLLRHPSYTGAILSLAGLGLSGGSWEGALLTVIVACLVYGYRIRVEEQFLLEQFGPEYLAYSKRTKRLVPYLW